jgi:nicotinic acid mononucleotide adenylyltransferase
MDKYLLPERVTGQVIAVFGLSANPPTGNGGHTGIVKYFVQSNMFSEIWILPVYKHIYSIKSEMVSFEQRLQMCDLCFSPETTPNCIVRVLACEKEVFDLFQSLGSAERVGTIDVLEYLQSRFRDKEFHFILGMDGFNDLVQKKWKQSDRYD